VHASAPNGSSGANDGGSVEEAARVAACQPTNRGRSLRLRGGAGALPRWATREGQGHRACPLHAQAAPECADASDVVVDALVRRDAARDAPLGTETGCPIPAAERRFCVASAAARFHHSRSGASNLPRRVDARNSQAKHPSPTTTSVNPVSRAPWTRPTAARVFRQPGRKRRGALIPTRSFDLASTGSFSSLSAVLSTDRARDELVGSRSAVRARRGTTGSRVALTTRASSEPTAMPRTAHRRRASLAPRLRPRRSARSRRR
jgi:hypothetical protein